MYNLGGLRLVLTLQVATVYKYTKVDETCLPKV